ncbi:MAG: hypothetical protein HY210_08370 [Candidatus Omnitrophica bacterium]|nr:hypothetical protein [Candidatus Omnitrophota bacterium]
MKQLCVSVRGLPIKALFLSLGIHLIVLNTFIFTLPLFRVSFKPSFIFLGSILKAQDLGDISQSKEKIDQALSFSEDPSSPSPGGRGAGGRGDGDLFFHSQSVGRRFIEGAPRQPVSPGSVGTREKIVAKSLFDIPADVKQEQTGSVADSLEADHEITPYKPLGLFPRELR